MNPNPFTDEDPSLIDAQHPMRRFADSPPSLDISQMIAAENDPKQRASLIVLHAISLALEANTSTVRDISIKLEKHLDAFAQHSTKEQDLLNQGRGAWRIMTWVLAIVQVVGLVLWNDTRAAQKEAQTELANINTAIQAGRMADNKIESRLGVLEQTK